MFKGFNYGLSSQPASTQGNGNVSGGSYTNTTKTTTHKDVSSTSNDDHTLPTTEPISTENTGMSTKILNLSINLHKISTYYIVENLINDNQYENTFLRDRIQPVFAIPNKFLQIIKNNQNVCYKKKE